MKLTNLLTLLGIGCISPLLPSHAHPTEPKAVLPYIIDNIIDNNKPNIININITYINTTIPQSAESIATAKHIPTAETTIATTKKTNGLACRFNVFWTSNWRDWGYHRYRVAAVTEGDKDGRDTAEDLLNRWCYHFRYFTYNSAHPYWWSTHNPQCWNHNDTVAYADISTFIGKHGHEVYVGLHERVIREWKAESSKACVVETNF